jgi:hypothetical protein
MSLILSLMLALALAQDADCLSDAAARLDEFDTPAAVQRLEAATGTCDAARIALPYVRGLVAARLAYRDGGSPESLAPVRQAIAELEMLGADAPGRAQIARLVLLAAASAAQSERDEMAVFLAEALRLEALQLAARQPPAPLVTAHEAAADLWLEVHRAEDAGRAYQTAVSLIGSRPRLTLGLARAAARLNDRSACAEYGAVVAWWGSRSTTPPEIDEARTFLAGDACQ